MELHEDDGRTTPRTLLAQRLRRMREASGLSLRALGDQVNFPYTYIGRVERGEQLPSEALAKALDGHFQADGLLLELLEMAQESLIAPYSRDFVAKERDALRIQVFTSSVIPGLLQTEEYARELFKISLPGETADKLNERVEARIARQRIFDREDPPLFWAIVDEAALKRRLANREHMLRQLEHLLRVADKPCVTVQVLPFEQALHPMLGGSLTLLTLKDGKTKTLVESFASGQTVDSPKGIVELVQYFDTARSMALPESPSLALIHRYLKEYAHGD